MGQKKQKGKLIEPQTEMKMRLFLSRKCSYCKKLVDDFGMDFYSLPGLQVIFYEDDINYFLNKFRPVKSFISKKFEEIKDFEYITPSLAIFTAQDELVVDVLIGYTSIHHFFSSIINKREPN